MAEIICPLLTRQRKGSEIEESVAGELIQIERANDRSVCRELARIAIALQMQNNE